MELGDLHAVFEKEREVRHSSKARFSLYLLLTGRPSFNPPSAQEAAAERLHFNPAHHGTDGEENMIHRPSLG